jgi:hypothetical protein
MSSVTFDIHEKELWFFWKSWHTLTYFLFFQLANKAVGGNLSHVWICIRMLCHDPSEICGSLAKMWIAMYLFSWTFLDFFRIFTHHLHGWMSSTHLNRHPSTLTLENWLFEFNISWDHVAFLSCSKPNLTYLHCPLQPDIFWYDLNCREHNITISLHSVTSE